MVGCNDLQQYTRGPSWPICISTANGSGLLPVEGVEEASRRRPLLRPHVLRLPNRILELRQVPNLLVSPNPHLSKLKCRS